MTTILLSCVHSAEGRYAIRERLIALTAPDGWRTT